jgi:putative SOS response-associated peptidase YedK
VHNSHTYRTKIRAIKPTRWAPAHPGHAAGLQGHPRAGKGMCNLYSKTSNQRAIRDLARAMEDRTGNLAPLPAIFPDQIAPVVRTCPDGSRELVMMRWRLPSPPSAKSKITTNIRNTASLWWRPWLQVSHRCLVPVTSFCEYDLASGKAVPTWFAQSEAREPFFFAGAWRAITAESRGDVGEHLVFSFLTTDPNFVVAPVHPRAMPVLLLTEAARETWLTGSLEDALALQRPAQDSAVKVVATGEKQDPATA